MIKLWSNRVEWRQHNSITIHVPIIVIMCRIWIVDRIYFFFIPLPKTCIPFPANKHREWGRLINALPLPLLDKLCIVYDAISSQNWWSHTLQMTRMDWLLVANLCVGVHWKTLMTLAGGGYKSNSRAPYQLPIHLITHSSIHLLIHSSINYRWKGIDRLWWFI